MSGEKDGYYITVLEDKWDALEADLDKALRENKRLREALEAIAYVDTDGEEVYDYLLSWCTGVAEQALKGEE